MFTKNYIHRNSACPQRASPEWPRDQCVGTMLSGIGRASRHSGLGGGTGQGSHMVLFWGFTKGLGTQVPIVGGTARKLAQAEVGWGLGAQWQGGPWSLLFLSWSQDRPILRSLGSGMLRSGPQTEADPEVSADQSDAWG